MVSFSITTFLLSKKLSQSTLLDDTRLLLERSGYSIIYETNKCESVTDFLPRTKHFPFLNYDLLVFCLDNLPWKKAKQNLRIAKTEKRILENNRTEWAIANVIYYLIQEKKLSTAYSNEFVLKNIYPVWDTKESLNYLENNTSDFTTLNRKIKKNLEDFRFPYTVINNLTDYGCNNAIASVIKDEKKYICKLFKENKIHNMENEIKVMRRFADDKFIPELIEVGENYILIKFYENCTSVTKKLNKIRLLPIKTAKHIFNKLKYLFDAGYIHMDFHPGNVIVHNQDIIFIDFEYLIETNNCNLEFENNPGLVRSSRLIYNSPLHYITYEQFWENLIGFKLKILMDNSEFVLILRRLPKYINFYLYYLKKLPKKLLIFLFNKIIDL